MTKSKKIWECFSMFDQNEASFFNNIVRKNVWYVFIHLRNYNFIMYTMLSLLFISWNSVACFLFNSCILSSHLINQFIFENLKSYTIFTSKRKKNIGNCLAFILCFYWPLFNFKYWLTSFPKKGYLTKEKIILKKTITRNSNSFQNWISFSEENV